MAGSVNLIGQELLYTCIHVGCSNNNPLRRTMDETALIMIVLLLIFLIFIINNVNISCHVRMGIKPSIPWFMQNFTMVRGNIP